MKLFIIKQLIFNRLDISVNDFWGGRYEKCYIIDVQMFNPFAPSNSSSSLDQQSCYRKHEYVKRQAYEARVQEVEHSSFTPLVFAATKGIMAMKLLHFIRDWPACYQTSGRNIMLLCWLDQVLFVLLLTPFCCSVYSRSTIL